MPSHPREYETIVEQVLKTVSDGPWAITDLEEARKIIDDDWCATHAPDCRSGEISEWLDSLDEDQQEELLFRLGTELGQEQDRWALG